ncbi:MAG: hypothetical protein R6W83_05760 [Cryobacterium sp.]
MAMFTPNRDGSTRAGTSLTRVFILAAALLVALLGLTFVPSGSPASAAQTIAQCNSVDNTGGLGLNCDVTVTNNLNVDTGVESSTVTVTECHGKANTAPICVEPVTTDYDSLTTSVSQCNDSANGGGASVVCNVVVTNNITGAATAGITDATVDQCNGSGAEGPEPTLDCGPFPASTTDATITQCNGTANGGGTALRVNCSVTPSTTSAQLPVSIDQCNDTANGGGSVVTCATSLTNVVLASETAPLATATPTDTPTPTPTDTASPVTAETPAAEAAPIAAKAPVGKNILHDSNTDGFTHAAANSTGSPVGLGAGVLMLAGLSAAAIAVRRVGSRR